MADFTCAPAKSLIDISASKCTLQRHDGLGRASIDESREMKKVAPANKKCILLSVAGLRCFA